MSRRRNERMNEGRMCAKMKQTRLILIDGMPGSGKSTTGQWLKETLESNKIPCRFFHELEQNHPLRIYDKHFDSFTNPEEAEWFIAKVKQLFRDFVEERLHKHEIAIVESYLFQNTIGFAYNMGMDESLLLDLAASIQSVLLPLQPALIYYYQVHVERNWRWICELRGPEFTQGRCGLYTDDDFVQAGSFWTANQHFVSAIVQEWEIPKLVIRNEHYLWAEYKTRIKEFLQI